MTRTSRGTLRRLSAVTVAGLALAMAVTGPALARPTPQVAGGWAQFQGNAAHTGSDPGETSVNRGNVGQLSVAWTAPLPNEETFQGVAVSGGAVYTAEGNVVTAVDATTGTQLWQVTVPGQVTDTPSVTGSLVVVGWNVLSGGTTFTGTIAALDSATGAIVWQRQQAANERVNGAITTTADRAYAMVGDPSNRQVEALGLRNGDQIWRSAAVPGCTESGPSVAGGLAVVGSGTDITALDTSTGAVVWQHGFGPDCSFTQDGYLPAISQGTVYDGTGAGVAAVSLATGTVQWENTSYTEAVYAASVSGPNVIVSDDVETQLVALSRADGSLQWQSHFGRGNRGADIADTFGQLAWTTTQPTRGIQLVALAPGTGRPLFKSRLYPDGGSPPVVQAGRVYATLGSELICLALPG